MAFPPQYALNQTLQTTTRRDRTRFVRACTKIATLLSKRHEYTSLPVAIAFVLEIKINGLMRDIEWSGSDSRLRKHGLESCATVSNHGPFQSNKSARE